MCCLRVMHLADENRAVVTSLVLVDFPAGLESSLRLLLASRGTRQGQHYRLLVISSNQDRRQTAHARTALTASACLVWVLLRASWFSALSVKILFLFLISKRCPEWRPPYVYFANREQTVVWVHKRNELFCV